MEGTRPLDRRDVSRLGDDADARLVAARVLADVAALARGVAEADGAEVDLLLDVENRLGKAAGLLGVRAEDVVGDALGALGANARKPAQLIEQTA